MHGKMKTRIIQVVMVLMFLLGLALLLYPAVSDYANARIHVYDISSYDREVMALDDSTYTKILEDAKAYNAELAERSPYFTPLSDEQWRVYQGMLSVAGSEIMAYIEIPKAQIYLPIYHGTDEATLNAGVGHYEGSSLPVGGKGVHTLLLGHRGLPSSSLFSDLDKLALGDTFTLHVLRESLVYEVDSIETVEPEELSNLQIEAGKDLCTLVTCTPYGVNTHRLLVRGHRITVQEENAIISSDTAPRGKVSMIRTELWIIPIIAISIFVLVILLYWRKRKRK